MNAVAFDPDDEEYTKSMQGGDDSGHREVNTVQIRTLKVFVKWRKGANAL